MLDPIGVARRPVLKDRTWLRLRAFLGLERRELHAPTREGRRSFFCTDAAERFGRVGATFFPEDVAPVFPVDI